ncbi:MAG: hypothetical protein EOM30_08630 [Clostridia bacterium]|nr:hypothetical protein [Clostridia bacterium]
MDMSTINTVITVGWDSLLKLMGSLIISLGGGAAIALFVFRFAADHLAERLKGKYQLELDKKLESYKADIDQRLESHRTELGTKQYITQKKFDFEFGVYQALAQSFFELEVAINTMIPIAGRTLADEDVQAQKENEDYENSVNKFRVAQNELRKNAPFIQEDIYEKYLEVIKLSGMQLNAYERRWNVGYLAPMSEKKKFTAEDFKRTEEITKKLDEINRAIRKYIDGLVIV